MTATPAPAEPQVSAQQPAAPDGANYANWILLGGGLLLVGGGAAFALTRRPKRRAETDTYVTTDADARVVAAAPIVVPERALSRPVHDPVPQRPVSASQVQRTVQPAVWQPVGDRRAALEAMIAEQPSEANPFHARRNRLRRADFLLRTGKAGPRQGEYRVTEERQPEPVGATDRWSEMRFRGKENTRVSWKPVTNR